MLRAAYLKVLSKSMAGGRGVLPAGEAPMPLLIDQAEDSRTGPAAAAACPSISWGLGLCFGWSSLAGSDITARVTGT